MARDWVTDRTTDVSDPFILSRDVIEYLEDELGGEDPSGDVEVLGNDSIGATSAALNINYKFGLLIDFPTIGTVDIEMYVAGDGANPGTLSLLGLVYDGISSTSELVDFGAEAAGATQGQAAGWMTIAEGLEVNSGNQFVGVLMGGTNGVATYRKETGPVGSSYYNADTYADGPASTFGVAIADTSIPSLRVTFTPGNELAVSIAELQAGVATLDITTAAHDTRISALEEGSGTGGSGFVTRTLANYPPAANAVIESTPESGGVVVASAAGDQNVTSLEIRDTSDGSTWRTRGKDDAGTTTFRSAQAVTTRLTQVRIVNGATLQGADFSAEVAKA